MPTLWVLAMEQSRKTTRITIETEALTIVHRAKLASAWCPECLAESSVVTLGSKSLEDPDNATEIGRWRSTGKLHLWQAANRSTQLCVKSLLECLDCEESASLVDLKGNTTT